MRNKMKALIKKLPERGLWMGEVPVPECGPNDVLIKIEKTSICGTDISIFEWTDWARQTIKTPMVIGHEYVGRIADYGSNVHDVHIGDMVTGEGHIVCGVCRNCLAGRRHLCPNTQGVGVNRDGAFAEYLCIPISNVWRCSDDISSEMYSIFDPLGNAVHTALSFDVIGEDILITGAGPIGIMAGAIVKHNGARHVVITDVNPYRLDLARKMGIAHVIDTRETSLLTVQHQLGMKEGFDVGLEMSGNSAAFNEMVENMCHGGKIAMLGIQKPDTRIDWNKVVFNSLIIKGIYGREMFETWYKMATMLQSGLDVSPIITHRISVQDFTEGFEIMSRGESGKIIIDWQ